MSIRIILVGTTHPGNIGAVARAMKNMGLDDLALVNPKIFPHADATARASGADDVLNNATVVATLAVAIKDCIFVAGASARSRSLTWPYMEPRECAAKFQTLSQEGVVAAVFGPEKSGLSNADLDHCDTLLTIPTNPDFSSLNVASAIQVLCYEIFQRQATLPPAVKSPEANDLPVPSGELEGYFEHLQNVLHMTGYLDPGRPGMIMQRLRRLYLRSEVTRNEINILRGMLTAIEKQRR